MVRTILRYGPAAALLAGILHAPGLSAAGFELASGWDHYGGSYAPAQAARQGRLCVVSGLVRTESRRVPGRATTIGKLSDDCRPAGQLIFNLNDHEQTARVDVYPDGRVIWRSGFGQNWVSLSGISFAVGKSAGLKLRRGWTNYGGAWQGARFAREGELCVVSGLVKASGKVSLPADVALLPPGCRPSAGLIFKLHANSHKPNTRVDVYPDGRIRLREGGGFNRWLSLSGIAFRVKRPGSDLELVNGWRQYGGSWQHGGFFTTGQLCSLTGLIRGRSFGHVANLPPGCRPAKRLIFNVHANTHDRTTRVDVFPDGRVQWVAGGKGGWISLAGIHYLAAAPAPKAVTPAIAALPARQSATARRPPAGEPVPTRLPRTAIRRGARPVVPLLVAHENGGNRLLRTVRPSENLRGLLPGNLSPRERLQREHELAVDIAPAWIYELNAGQDMTGVTVSGAGVAVEIVDPDCVTDQASSVMDGAGLCEAPSGGRSLHVRFAVAKGAGSGDRDILVTLASGEQRRYGTLRVARTGTASLTHAAYLPLGAGQADPIPVSRIRNGEPLIGELRPAALRAPQVRLTFSGPGVGGMKFSAPGCLESAASRRVDGNTLEVTARFSVPGDIAAGSRGIVSSRAELPSGDCNWFVYDPVLDRVIASSPAHEGKALGNFTFLSRRESTTRVMPQYLTMAGIGDSYSAGEGAPDAYDPARTFARWELRQCHRSGHSRLTQAARKVAEIPSVWIVYRNFACSGATIHVGYLGPYMGVPFPAGQPTPDPLPPQKDQLTNWLSSQDLTLDVLLIGFGGNEAGFSTAIAKCVAPEARVEVHDDPVAQFPKNCQEQDGFLQEINNGSSTALRGLENLDDAFDALADGLSDIDPGNIFITEYPDPLSYSADDRCNKFVQFDDQFAVLPEHVTWGDLVNDHPLARLFKFGGKIGNLTYDEVVWLRESFLDRVNREVELAADRHDWTYVSGHVEHSADHGYCTRDTYINTFAMSVNTQGDFFGSVHPTARGYHVYGDVIAREIIRKLGLPPRPDIAVIQESNSQQPAVVVLGDPLADDPTLVSLVHADPTRFRIQLAPTNRTLDVRFRFQRRNRFSGANVGAVERIPASRNGAFQIRTEYFADRTLNICETLEYGWDITHSGPDGTRTVHTDTRRITPVVRAVGEDAHCPRN